MAFGIETGSTTSQKVAAFPQMAVGGGDVREMIDFVNDEWPRFDRNG